MGTVNAYLLLQYAQGIIHNFISTISVRLQLSSMHCLLVDTYYISNTRTNRRR